MSRSDTDTAKEIIYRALKVLRDYAEETNDDVLVDEIDEIHTRIFLLETEDASCTS